MQPARALNAQPDRLILAVTLPLVLLVCLALYGLLSAPQPDAVGDSTGSTWDLRRYDLSRESVQLSGQVSCIPGALLTPAEYAAREGEAVLLDDAFPEQYGTSRLLVALPDDGWYTFSRTSIDFATRLYVNGELLADVGVVADNAGDARPNIGRITFTAKAQNGVVELVQQSSNFAHRSGGYHGGWLVGGARLSRAVQAADWAVVLEMGAYFTLFFMHLLLFLMQRGYRPNLYFALFCLTWFFRMGATGASLFTVLAGWLPWDVKFRLEYAAVSIAILLTGLILRDVFPGVMQRWALRVIYVSNALFLLLCLVLSKEALSWVALAFLGLCVLTAGYILVRFAMKLQRPRIDQSLFLTGLGMLVCTALRDITCYAIFVADPAFRYLEVTQIAVLAFALLAATGFFIATMREVREAKAAEERLAAENAALEQVSQLKTSLMGTLSHELRTPLAVMSGYAQLSEKQISDGSADDETRHNLRVVSREAQRLADLASGLMQDAITRDRMKKRQSLPVTALFERATAVARPILEKRGNRLVCTTPEGLAQVWVNADMVHQVLLNLLTNANRYTRDGAVELAAQPAASEGEQGFVLVTVADNGRGIAPELLPRVLETRVTDGSGSGFGLAICKQIVEAHGGRIGIANMSGGGTQVRFTLPVAAPQQEGEEEA